MFPRLSLAILSLVALAVPARALTVCPLTCDGANIAQVCASFCAAALSNEVNALLNAQTQTAASCDAAQAECGQSQHTSSETAAVCEALAGDAAASCDSASQSCGTASNVCENSIVIGGDPHDPSSDSTSTPCAFPAVIPTSKKAGCEIEENDSTCVLRCKGKVTLIMP